MAKLSRVFVLAWLGLTACSGHEGGTPGAGIPKPNETTPTEEDSTTPTEEGATTPTEVLTTQSADAGLAQPADAGLPQPTEVEPVTLFQTSGICVGQQATVPRSRMVERALTGTTTTASRTEAAVYVAYQASNSELFVYFSFDPSLPRTPDTQTARAMLKYAYVNFQLKQPDRIGGSLQLLSSGTLLHLEDFASFEVQSGRLKWRLVKQSEEHYAKPLTIYDADPSNDPNPRDECASGDILGMCFCEFTGPAITVTIDGSLPL
jgi:hypothetical protein